MSLDNELSNTGFDYASLPGDHRVLARSAAATIKERLSSTAKGYIAIGNELLKVKAALPPGTFLKWITAEFNATEKTAQNMMRAAEYAKNNSLSDMTHAPTALIILSAPSTPAKVRERVAERAAAGEVITGAVVKSEVAAAKAESTPETCFASPRASSDAKHVSHADEADAPETVSHPIPAEPSHPWSAFNESVEDAIRDVEAATRKLAKVLGFNAKQSTDEPFAYFMDYGATIGLIRDAKKNVLKNLPAEVAPGQPGFVNVATSESRARRTKEVA